MNYRHGYHAGNFADVFKHAIVALIVDHLKQKPRPFWLLDCHAGAGQYQLDSIEAQKTREARDGIQRVYGAPPPPGSLGPYLDTIRSINRGQPGPPRIYPGSPVLMRALLRPVDRLVAVDLHPADAAALARHFAGDSQTRVLHQDGYQALKALLPPHERRGMALLDPPYERTDEAARLVAALDSATRRWATGIYAIWYPVKDPAEARSLADAIVALGLKRLLRAELMILPTDNRFRLNGCGMIIHNPPWSMADQLGELLPYLEKVLGRDGGASRVDWLAGE